MELHSAAGLTSSFDAQELCEDYLNQLPLTDTQRCDLLSSIGRHAVPPSMVELHYTLAGRQANRDNPAYGSVPKRLQIAYANSVSDSQGKVVSIAERKYSHHAGLLLMPPVNRMPMAPVAWGALNPIKRGFEKLVKRNKCPQTERKTEASSYSRPFSMPSETEQGKHITDQHSQYSYLGNIRRFVLVSLMLGQTAVATYFMSNVLPYQGKGEWEWALLALFALLFCWVSAGFWTAMAGFLVLLRGKDRYAISSDVDQSAPIPPNAKTAIIMPICNEDIVRVIAGLRATYESVETTGELRHFEFFILSDTNEGDTRTAEIAKWAELCKAVNGFGRIFYRHRKRRVKRKSGNIDDFCRRWGKNYRYMIVLDADSVMSGTCITKLVRMMEAHPDAGIIQTAPIAAGRDTLYARIQQFATRVYGPLFTAGLHYWQLGESHYWGHNAIIRMVPLMKHCVLSPLPGRGSLAGEILSHDFVEAALMRRAGWRVWIAYDMEGSYEEMPPNLLDELKRDRRWCHGNLMNFRLFTARGMHPVHRAVFATGVMAYLSAPLWFLFLALSTALLAMHVLVEPQYFQQPEQLFPIWPQWHPEKAIALFTATATLLFLPKILSVLLAMRNARQFGGAFRLATSMLLEMLFSMLLAPVRMLFHTKFVAAAFLGIALHWKSPPRDDTETHWGEAFGKHGLHALVGIAWGGFVYWLNPSLLPWLLPIAAGLVLSPLISAFSSRVTLGRWFRRAKIFTIPEEMSPPLELQQTVKYAQSATPLPTFVDAITDPSLNALACAAAKHRNRSRLFEELDGEHSFQDAAAMGERQKNAVLNDASCLSKLHQHAWSSPQMLARWAPNRTVVALNVQA